MADNTRRVGSMYGILIDLKEDYDKLKKGESFEEFMEKETFEQYAQRKLDMLKRQALEWIAEDDELMK